MDVSKYYGKISTELKGLVDSGERDFVIFPYGFMGRLVSDVLETQYGISPKYILDNNLCRINPNIKSLDILKELDPDKYMVILAAENPLIIETLRYLLYSAYREDRIFEVFCYQKSLDLRVTWLRELSKFIYEKKLEGSVAECGVFRGEFAKYINMFFPDKKCYLFDSFEGFSDDDITSDRQFSSHSSFFNNISQFQDTSLEHVLNKMPNIENVIVKKGFVPATFEGVDDTFCFVNLDMDIYAPTLEALNFFYPRMVSGGVMLLHDYFSGHDLPGIRNAVCEFEKDTGYDLIKIPSEVSGSLAIVIP